jgi:hypothetical protein
MLGNLLGIERSASFIRQVINPKNRPDLASSRGQISMPRCFDANGRTRLTNFDFDSDLSEAGTIAAIREEKEPAIETQAFCGKTGGRGGGVAEPRTCLRGKFAPPIDPSALNRRARLMEFAVAGNNFLESVRDRCRTRRGVFASR